MVKMIDIVTLQFIYDLQITTNKIRKKPMMIMICFGQTNFCCAANDVVYKTWAAALMLLKSQSSGFSLISLLYLSITMNE